MRKNMMLWTMIITLFCFYAPVCHAEQVPAEPVGSVIALRGTATAHDALGKSRALALKSPVYEKDELRTGPAGRMQVLFKDNTIVSLGRSSTLKISQYVWKPSEKTGSMQTTVKEGVFRVMGGAITKEAPDNFTTDTPAATIGIRGSMYAGKVTGDQLMVVFEGGKGIDVSNTNGSVAITNPGFGTYVGSADQPPLKPKRFSSRELSGLNVQLGTNTAMQDESEEESSADEDQSMAGASDQTDPATEDEEDTQAADSASGSEQDDSEVSTGDQEGTDTQETQSDESDVSYDDSGALDAETEAPLEDTSAITGLSTAGTVSQDIIDTSTAALQDNLEDQLNEIVQGGFIYSGAFLAQRFVDNTTTDFTIWYSNTLAASLSDGFFSITGSDQHGQGFSFGFELSLDETATSYVPPFDNNENLVTSSQTQYVEFEGVGQTFVCDVAYDNLGEFALFAVKDGLYTIDSVENYYQELGFAGVPSSAAQIPVNGVSSYRGFSLGIDTSLVAGDTLQKGSGITDLFLEVNWLCGKAIGYIADPDGGGDIFFFADVSGGLLTNVQLFGYKDEASNNSSIWVQGAGGVAGFYGSACQGLGISGFGVYYDISGSQTSVAGSGQMVAGAFRETQDSEDVTSPTGTSTFQGFITGCGENINSPQTDRRLFMNTSSSDFTLEINRDSGTISGLLSASDIVSGTTTITNLEIGGDYGSAYVLDDNMIAFIGDSGSDAITSGTYSGGLKDYGNYWVCAPLDEQFSDYVTWGYWEIAYMDPESDAQYNVHMPGSYWIAGELTPSSTISDLAAGSISGTYSGMAQGIYIDTGGTVTEMTNGTSTISVNFGTSAVSGSITFSEISLALESGGLTAASSSFSAQITGATSSSVQGCFYGPSAQSIGGNFNAGISGSTYIGIFGGNR